MKRYEHVFFDLDHTLWDFETNSQLALQQIYRKEGLAAAGVRSFEAFYLCYKPINDRYWARYHNNAVSKAQLRIGRFADALGEFGINDLILAERMAQAYIDLSPQMTALFPETTETLSYLQTRYKLHLITNGFAEVQWIKLENAGLKPFFEHIIISEEVGTQKPDKQIFDLAMQRAKTGPDRSVMIGDNFKTDILGARNAGMDQIYFNPRKEWRKDKATYEISTLPELRKIL